MVDHDLLHRELANLSCGGSLFDLHEGLHQLGMTAVAALHIDGAGVTVQMPDGDTRYITATDAATLHVEQRQDDLQQGACVDAISASQPIAVNDLTADPRWPDFTPVVLDAGFQAVAGVPICFRGTNIGALNLYARTKRAWAPDELTAGRLIADLAGGFLVNAHLLEKSQTLAAQLQHALDSRIIIEQAKGVMVGRCGITPDDAFKAIRDFARSHRMLLHDLAQEIVSGKAGLLRESIGAHEPAS